MRYPSAFSSVQLQVLSKSVGTKPQRKLDPVTAAFLLIAFATPTAVAVGTSQSAGAYARTRRRRGAAAPSPRRAGVDLRANPLNGNKKHCATYHMSTIIPLCIRATHTVDIS
ncbi:hypothetical protein EVAR_80554_1 [Eumeta japonica]|uniref:Uncharacterized protein n=1 Tax=Eumeta variegata TaxID=151549 RepID=A0A4C1TLC2_EUMVA|nr:hypothetical protein EVAR_80554_1 [Eumeta japonica]